MQKIIKTVRVGILFSFVALVMLLTSLTCFAQTSVSVDYLAETESITVSLETDRKERTATVTVKSNGKYWVMAEFERTDKDTFTYTCDLPSDCPSDTYTVEVIIGGEKDIVAFNHINKQQSINAMIIINSATENTFGEAIEQTYDVLAVDYDKFLAHKEMLTKLYFKYKPQGDLTSADFSVHYGKCLAICEIAAESDYELAIGKLQTASNKIGFDYDSFNDLTKTEKEEILDRFCTGIYTEDTLGAQYEMWFVLANINSLRDSSVDIYREALFVTHDMVLQLDKTDYNDIADKDEAIQLVMANKYDTIPSILEAFNNAVLKADVKKPIGGSPGGNSSDSGFNSNRDDVTVVGSQKKEPVNKDEINVTSNLYSDVSEKHWCAEEIESFSKKGIISGTGDGKFEPERNVTRAEFSKMLIETFFKGELKNVSEYDDVAQPEWYAGYIGKAASLEIVSGDGSGKFRPNDNISRQDMAVMIYRTFKALNISLKESNSHFSDDADISDYASEAVCRLAGNGILNGMGNNTYEPFSNLTRAQAVKALYQTLEFAEGR